MAPATRADAPSPCPDLLARVIASSVACDPERVADTALERLAAAPEDCVLELGCGSGRLLFRLAARARRGRVVGIDPSELMVRHARHRNRRWIAAGRAAVEQASSRDLSRFEPASFERVLGVHVVCFWQEPLRDLAQVRRVLRPEGVLLLAFRPAAPGERPPAGRSAHAAPPQVEDWLRRSGFAVEDRSVSGSPALAWVRARRRGELEASVEASVETSLETSRER